MDKVDQEIRQTLQLADVKTRFADAGFETAGVPSREFAARIKQDAARFKAVVDTAGIKAN